MFKNADFHVPKLLLFNKHCKTQRNSMKYNKIQQTSKSSHFNGNCWMLSTSAWSITHQSNASVYLKHNQLKPHFAINNTQTVNWRHFLSWWRVPDVLVLRTTQQLNRSWRLVIMFSGLSGNSLCSQILIELWGEREWNRLYTTQFSSEGFYRLVWVDDEVRNVLWSWTVKARHSQAELVVQHLLWSLIA